MRRILRSSPNATSNFSNLSIALGAALITSLILAPNARAAGTETVLHAFAVHGNDGSSVYSSLALDASGNLYGTTVDGGTHNAGIVFRLSPSGTTWKETVLYNFTGGADGGNSFATVTLDAAGNLYGTTSAGGATQRACRTGCGVVFQLTPTASGQWTETVLHTFKGTDGAASHAGVIFDADGNLYGVTTGGGSAGLGVLYKLTPLAGAWTETVLHNFTGNPDGKTPYATPILDSAGNLFGTTYEGGAHNQGSVYEVTTQPTVTERVLYSFKGSSDGSEPFGGVIFDQSGNLYGATSVGGTANCGTAFKLNAANNYAKSILHQFLGLSVGDGANPNGLIFDGTALYGTTVGGGLYNPGTIFKLAAGSGGWKETVLYNFTGGNDGAYPSVPLTIDAAGKLYGTTLWGGPAGDTVGGVVFQFIP